MNAEYQPLPYGRDTNCKHVQAERSRARGQGLGGGVRSDSSVSRQAAGRRLAGVTETESPVGATGTIY